MGQKENQVEHNIKKLVNNNQNIQISDNKSEAIEPEQPREAKHKDIED